MAFDSRELTVKINGDARDLNKTLNNTDRVLETTSKHGKASFLKLGAVMGVTAGIAQNVFQHAISGVSGALGDAIKRVDTLKNSNNIFADMGFKAEDVHKAMAGLDKSIRGLPTSLDQAVSGVELLAGSTHDIGKAQKVFSALNDAVIGFGGSAEDVQGAVQQLSQAFSNGKVDAQTWNSLMQNGLGPALDAIAKKMGITTGALKDGLSKGKISVGDFQNALIEMDTKGGGGMKSFQKTAKDATDGIGTGMENAKTAIVRGLADIIQSIGSKNISSAISGFGKGVETMFKGISDKLPAIIDSMKGVADAIIGYLKPKFEILWNSIQTTLLPAIGNLVKAFGPAVGAGLVWAIGFAMDTLNALVKVAGPVFNFLSDHTWIVWALVGAFVALKTALVIDNAVKAFSAGMAIVRGEAVLTSGTIASTTRAIGLLRGALVALTANPWVIGVSIVGTAAVLADLYTIKKVIGGVSGAMDDLSHKTVDVGNNIKVKGNSSLGLIEQFKNHFGMRASGGPVSAGTPYIVGERGPELVIPGNSGTVVDAKNTQKMLSSQGGGDIHIHISPQIGLYAGMPVEKRQIALELWKELTRAARSQGVQLPNIGAISVQ